MATVTGYTAARMQEIEDSAIVDGDIVGNDLVLLRHDGTPINAGNVRGPQGPTGPPGAAETEVWENWTSVSGDKGSMTLTPVSHASNHSRFLVVGKLCFVSFSQVFNFGGTIQQGFSMTLPIVSAVPRQTFNGHVQNYIANATTGDEYDKVLFGAIIGVLWTATVGHASFQGFYEIA